MFCCLYVFLDSQSRKEQAPSNAARKREIAVMAGPAKISLLKGLLLGKGGR
jgi:hypothetical protein